MEDPYADVGNLFKSCGNVCAIVYCLERTTCDDLATHLSKIGINCAGNWMFPFLLLNFGSKMIIPDTLKFLLALSISCGLKQ